MRLNMIAVLLLTLAPVAATLVNTRVAQACYTGCIGSFPNKTCVAGGDGAATCWSDGWACHFQGTCVG